MTITSEAFLSIGIILVSIVLAMVAGRVIEFQALGVFEQTQENFLNEIDSIITSLGPYDGTREVQYNPPVKNYDLYVQENSVIEINIDETPARASFTEKHIENTFIQNAEVICIVQSDRQLEINEGRCTEDLTDFCSGTRCEDGQQCYVDKGETCVSDDCECPPLYEGYENDPKSTDFCKPDYTPVDTVVEDGQVVDHLTETGCLTEPYFQYREEGETCQENFECNNTLKCLEDIDKNNFYCCPEGERYDESEGECLEHVLDKGDECDPFDDLCDDGLNCEPADPEMDTDQDFCCPPGQQYNEDEDECDYVDFYDILYVPLVTQANEGTFETVSEGGYERFVEDSPFEDDGSQTESHIITDPSGDCDINCNIGDLEEIYGQIAFVNQQCWGPISQCAQQFESETGIEPDLVHGICDETCDPPGGLGGVAEDIDSRYAFTILASGKTNEDIVDTMIHEKGHNFGLRHVHHEDAPDGPGGICNQPMDEDLCYTVMDNDYDPNLPYPNIDDCEEDLTEILDFYMSYCDDKSTFGPHAFQHLEEYFEVFLE